MQHLVRPSGSPPVNGYSHAVVTRAGLAFISGQLPLDPEGDLVGPEDAEQQFRQVFANLDTALAAVGSGMDRLVKLTVFLTDLGDLAVFRHVRDACLDSERLPSCSLVQVAGLMHPQARVEIEAVAETDSV